MTFTRIKALGFVVAATALLSACKKDEQTVWIYASYYKEVIAMHAPVLKAAFPDVKIQWYQAGSENVSAKIQAELTGGQPQADIMMTSDMFFFQELAEKGELAPLQDPAFLKLPAENLDPERRFALSRWPVMVLIHNESVPEAERPKSFKDLVDPRFKGKITMPSPLESGSAMSAALYLKKMYGEEYFKGLRANDMLAAGGNGATLSRVQSGEKTVGMVLIENVLQAMEKGQKNVRFVIPSEGALAIGSPIAVLKRGRNAEVAQKIAAWFMSSDAQDLLIKGWIYSAIPGSPTPAGAPEWSALKLAPWDLGTFREWSKERQATKDMFQNIVLR